MKIISSAELNAYQVPVTVLGSGDNELKKKILLSWNVDGTCRPIVHVGRMNK